ncbi:metallophosphoesterase family protein [Fervidicoccus fontis]|uniref:Metallophosphoesterase family protein n=1 Tax=Fervidicoccus fontis TaxID=683846 RepID=A0A843AB93_9CREN|nr:metallophosphoesterase family protein [Fervidicoccus fontis]
MKWMKLLQIGDIHCSLKNLKRLLELRDELEYEIAIVHGDLECDGEIVDLLEKLSDKILFVPGNMDDVGLIKIFTEKSYNIDSKLVKLGEYYFLGIGGQNFYSSYTYALKKLEEMKEKRNLVIVSHHPPITQNTDVSFGGIHIGLPELTEIDEKYSPLAHLHGHVHESPGIDYIGDTLVVNAGSLMHGNFAIVDIKNRKAEIKKIV